MTTEFNTPVDLKDDELDAVSGGLVTIVDFVDVERNDVTVQVAAGVAVAALGAAAGAAAGNRKSGQIN
jgi:hypothetical protein